MDMEYYYYIYLHPYYIISINQTVISTSIKTEPDSKLIAILCIASINSMGSDHPTSLYFLQALR